MIPRIKEIKPLDNYMLYVVFDDGKSCLYDVKEDIDTIEQYQDLELINGLFNQVQLDESRTCVFWNDSIDLPSDTIYEYGKPAKIGYNIMSDDEFCENLYQHYLNSDDKDESYTLEECKKEWGIETVVPDEWDKQMLADIEADPECGEFVSKEDAMKELGF